MEDNKYINHLDLREKTEYIRLKKLEEMTREDALYVILTLINDSRYFPCGYSHTIHAYEILKKGDSNEKR